MLTPQDKAKCGLWLIEEAIMELLTRRGDWASHSEIQDELDLRSEYEGGHTGYLSGSILDKLVKQNCLGKEKRGNKTYYRTADPN